MLSWGALVVADLRRRATLARARRRASARRFVCRARRRGAAGAGAGDGAARCRRWRTRACRRARSAPTYAVRVELRLAVVALPRDAVRCRRSTATTRAAPTSARPISGSCAATASASSRGLLALASLARARAARRALALFVAALVACDAGARPRRCASAALQACRSTRRCAARRARSTCGRWPRRCSPPTASTRSTAPIGRRRARARSSAVVAVAAVALELAVTWRAREPVGDARRHRGAPRRRRLAARYGRPGRATNDVHLGNAAAQHGPALALRDRRAATARCRSGATCTSCGSPTTARPTRTRSSPTI